MKDFFISYTETNEAWAEWIAWTLEEAKYSTVLQAWDFYAGSNFVVNMQRALQEAKRVIAVLSPNYIQSEFGGAEWAVAFAEDPLALKSKLVPVLVEPCQELPGLLRPIVRIDIVGLDEVTARQVLLAGLTSQRKKPPTAPPFPTKPLPQTVTHHPVFPAVVSTRPPSSAPFIPPLRPKMTDLNVQKFIRESFEEIQDYFRRGLVDFAKSSPRREFQFRQVDQSRFIAEAYVDGKLCSCAKVWVGSVLGSRNQIGYFQGVGLGSDWDDTVNEIITAVEGDNRILLKALMHSFAMLGRSESAWKFDPERLTREQAAEYLWLRFTAFIES